MGILRNYDNYMAAINLGIISTATSSVSQATDVKTFGDGHINITNTWGSLVNFGYSSQNRIPPFSLWTNEGNKDANLNASQRTNLICGNGTKEESYDDYGISLISNLTPITHQVKGRIYDADTKTWSVVYEKTFNTLNDITITEIGAVYNGYNTNGGGLGVLVYRKLLDEPIEVPAGANFILSFTTKVSANPNKPAAYDASAAVVE